MYEIFILALALSIDATVVSFTQGLIFKSDKFKTALTLGLFFGLFQGLMPLIGAFITGFVYDFLISFSKWIILFIFSFLGLKFIFESLKGNPFESTPKCLSFYCLLLFSISTSIDALAAGAALKLTGANLIFSAFVIAIVTFVNSFIGFFLSLFLNKFNPKYIQILGGIVLILLGIKELFKN